MRIGTLGLRFTFTVALLIVTQVAVAQNDATETNEATGPQLGNGIRNSWANQTSIVVWTRTTRNAEMVTDGPQFKTVSKSESQKLEKQIRASGDDSRYLSSQLADGKTLDQMLGACPGAAGQVRVSWHPTEDATALKSTGWKNTTADDDFTAQWKLTELLPGTEYSVVVEARPGIDQPVSATRKGRFKTSPAADKSASLKFCVTTCHDFERRDDGEKGHKIYPSMTAIQPDFVVHAGDIEYYDKPHPWAWTTELMRFKWSRIFSMPRNREFYSTHSTYFIKDDHDTLKNDSWPGQTYGNVTFEEGVRLFNLEQFPSHELRYQTVAWGRDVQIWILEGRDYRSANNLPDGPDKSILGVAQKAWLKKTLRDSTATFKLVFSPTPIVGPDRAKKKDNHANEIFAVEGQELREFFGTVEGLIVFCGDRHWQYASVDADTGVWEFGCGPGSEKHQLGWKKGDVRPVHRFLRVAGGFLSGEVTHDAARKAKLTLHHHAVDGTAKSTFRFPAEQQSAK